VSGMSKMVSLRSTQRYHWLAGDLSHARRGASIPIRRQQDGSYNKMASNG
jgi:hypothetical protein